MDKELYFNESADKQMLISVDGTKIAFDNSMIESEAFEMDESLCSESELKFGTCEANSVKFTVHDTPGSIVGKNITITETVDGDTDNPFQYGKYKIYSDVPSSDRTKREITAYDAMYDIINADVKSWYAGLSFPMTLKQFRNSFFSYLGIGQTAATLPNDSMTVTKTLTTEQTDDSAVTAEATVSGKTIIEAICEINGCFGNINRNGEFEYIFLKEITSALYPRDDLFPADNVFPSDANTESMTGHYISFDYEDFQSKAITQLEIRTSDSNAGMTAGIPGNNYVISGNFLVSDKTGTELEQIANNILPVMKQAEYIPIKSCTCVGNPCLMLGEPIRFNTTREIVETYLLQRTLSGVQCKRDSITAQGTETHSAKVNSMRETLSSVERRTNLLERNADHLLSQYEDLDKSTSSKFEQTAEQIATEVTNRQNADSEMSSRITQTSDAIVAEVTNRQNADSEMSSRITQTSDAIVAEVTNRQNADSEMSSRITQTSDAIVAEVTNRQNADNTISASLELKVGKNDNDQVVSMINASADEINLKGNRLIVSADNFSLTRDGTATMIDAVIVNTLRYAESVQGSDYELIGIDGRGNLMLDIPKIYNSAGNNNVHFERTPIVDNPNDGIQTYLARETWCNNKFATSSDILSYVSSALNGYAKSTNGNTWFGTQTFNTDIKAPCIRDRSSTAAANVRCQDNTYYLATSATSSRRYKHNIADISREELNPARLYNLPVRQFVYNLDYIEPDDQRYGETVCGFIAEEVEKIYPVACEYNANNTPENWDIRYIIPPMLALVQDQHKEIEQLKQDNFSLKGEVDILKQRLRKMEEMLDVINSKIS